MRGRHSEEGGKALDPLKLQLPPMYQYECIHSPLRKISHAATTVFRRGGGCQHSRIMASMAMRGNGLLGAQLTLEVRFSGRRRCARPGPSP